MKKSELVKLKSRKPQGGSRESYFDHDREFRKMQGDIGDATWG